MPEAWTQNRGQFTEAELIERAKAFHADAWNALYDTYYPKMYTFLYIRLGDRTAAEDLAADVFEQACKGIRRFQYRGVPISAWLYRIAHNLLVDFLKRRRRGPVTQLDRENSPQPSTNDASDTIALRDELSRALRKLTAEQQLVLLLRHTEGHDVATTARITDKKENAVRAQEFRALRSLRRILSEDGWGKRRKTIEK